ncbi:MAG: hypothetical protein AAGI25_18465 [Bacteroidota bacterium]
MNIKMILLDARYFRDELLWENPGTNNKTAKPNLNGEILGEEQWQWLEQQVEEPNIDLLIIASGIQILPEEHGFEKWANFPKERTKLFQLTNAKLVFNCNNNIYYCLSLYVWEDVRQQSKYEKKIEPLWKDGQDQRL